MAGMGHEDAFLRPRLNARYRFSKGTLAGTRGNGREAPLTAILLGWIKPPRSIPLVALLATAEASFLIVLTGRDVLGFMKTVRVLGLSMPPARLARVDVVI